MGRIPAGGHAYGDPMKLGWVAVCGVLWVATTACQGHPNAAGAPAVAAGKERGDCRPDKGCDPGLLCLSNLCVRPPPADCQVVADQLASMDLGNYAEAEERAPVVARYKAACDKAYVSKEQGVCLDKAKSKWDAAQCAPELFPELKATGKAGCDRVATKLRTSMSRQMGNTPDTQTQQMFGKVMTVVQESCEQDGWPEALKSCILLSKDGSDGMTECNGQMPSQLQQQLQARMVKAMQ
jgi:hypothetical protein